MASCSLRNMRVFYGSRTYSNVACVAVENGYQLRSMKRSAIASSVSIARTAIGSQAKCSARSLHTRCITRLSSCRSFSTTSKGLTPSPASGDGAKAPKPNSDGIPLSSLPASVRIFARAFEKRRVPLSPIWVRPKYLPIIERLPPLPMIYSETLARSALGINGTEVERTLTMAQIGDRMLGGITAFSIGRGLFPIQRAREWARMRATNTIMGAEFATNASLSYLACIYGLHRLQPRDLGTQHWMASIFEAWIYAAKEDASRRGFKARGVFEAQLEQMFDPSIWRPVSSIPKSYAISAPPKVPIDKSHTLSGLDEPVKEEISDIRISQDALDRFYKGQKTFSNSRESSSNSVDSQASDSEHEFEGHPAQPYIHRSHASPVDPQDTAMESTPYGGIRNSASRLLRRASVRKSSRRDADSTGERIPADRAESNVTVESKSQSSTTTTTDAEVSVQAGIVSGSSVSGPPKSRPQTRVPVILGLDAKTRYGSIVDAVKRQMKRP